MKILLIALSGIGDALMFTPALQLLKKKLPSSQIDCLAMYKGVEDIYGKLPQINKVILHPFLQSGILNNLQFVLDLRKKYDATINVYPSNRWQYNFISFLINAKNRFAVQYIHQDKFNLGFLNNMRITENMSYHNVEENIKLVEHLTGNCFDEKPSLIFPLTEREELFADDFLRNNRINENDTIVGFHPGCSELKNHKNRRWEPEKFSSLGNLLIEKHKAKILVFGGPEENELKRQITDGIKSSDALSVSTSNLAETASIIKRCAAFVTNDSSLMHVASALKRKVVAVIGPTNPALIHPWNTEHKIASLNLDCAPCFYYSPKPLTCTRRDVKFKCIKELTVEHVYNAVKNYLK